MAHVHLQVTLDIPALDRIALILAQAVTILADTLVTDPQRLNALRADVQQHTAALQAALAAVSTPAAP